MQDQAPVLMYEREVCHCGTRNINPSTAFAYVDDKPVCYPSCYRAVMGERMEVDGFCNWGGSVERPME